MAGGCTSSGTCCFSGIFGRNVEDLIGGPSFLAFYLLAGIAAGIVQVVVNPYSTLPTIGASGAIAGVMGAYLIKFPREPSIVTLIFVFFFVTAAVNPGGVYSAVLVRHSVFQSGFGSWRRLITAAGASPILLPPTSESFLAGMALIRLFPVRKRLRAWYDED